MAKANRVHSTPQTPPKSRPSTRRGGTSLLAAPRDATHDTCRRRRGALVR